MAEQQPTHATPETGRPRDAIYWLALTAAAVTIGLTAAAFWLSYAHLAEVAGTHGLTGERMWAWPATLDAFIVIGEILILRSSLQGRVDWWAITLTAAGSAGSIALNIAGVGAGAPRLDYVVAAVPPVAALLAFGALMRQIHGILAAHVATPATPAETPDTAQQTGNVELDAPDTGDTTGDDQPNDEPAPPVTYDSPVDRAIRPLYETGYRPTTKQMRAAMTAAGLGDSESTARASRQRIERTEPGLATYPSALGREAS
ncbi:DUF2637 domain-containing protein [Streptomyces sp. 3MP-14]|uniref:DUF2637 domain-containing protein n=1 Tax=Streptomyces mimosae TaxID=2586635 RepID=A0A5N6A3B9_9ACTN|nr:DUF2637 domain-containing protein [Streptomyces mimosae]KAB8179149.1 DUF2637 domain-containing protein [Streptomyces sp. 3MP-14]